MAGSGQHPIGKEPFRIGVDYWPRRTGLDLWNHFDVDEVQEDFSLLAELGANLAQITLIWEDFQPEPTGLRCRALAHLLSLCDAAASEGIRLELLLFSGHLAAVGSRPEWLELALQKSMIATSEHARGSLLDPIAVEAATTFAQGIARNVGGHPAVWSYNLGAPFATHAQSSLPGQSRVWLDELSRSIRAIDPKHAVTCDLTGTELTSRLAAHADEVCAFLDHSTFCSDGLLGDVVLADAKSRAAFGCALSTTLTGKPCMVKSDGFVAIDAPNSSCGSYADAEPLESLLRDVQRVGALGAIVGPFSDEPGRGGRQGLVTGAGEICDRAEGIKDFAQVKPLVNKGAIHSLTLGVTLDEFFGDPGRHLQRLFREFRSQLDSAPEQ